MKPVVDLNAHRHAFEENEDVVSEDLGRGFPGCPYDYAKCDFSIGHGCHRSIRPQSLIKM